MMSELALSYSLIITAGYCSASFGLGGQSICQKKYQQHPIFERWMRVAHPPLVLPMLIIDGVAVASMLLLHQLKATMCLRILHPIQWIWRISIYDISQEIPKKLSSLMACLDFVNMSDSMLDTLFVSNRARSRQITLLHPSKHQRRTAKQIKYWVNNFADSAKVSKHPSPFCTINTTIIAVGSNGSNNEWFYCSTSAFNALERVVNCFLVDSD